MVGPNLNLGPRELVAVVGAGGKTSLCWAIADDHPERSVVVTTTTKFGVDQARSWPVLLPTDTLPRRCVVVGQATRRKLVGISPEQADGLAQRFDLVLCEADGARHKLVKAPAGHEPVIPASTTVVAFVMAAEAIDRVIEDVAHRPMRTAAAAGCGPYERLTPERAARLLTSPIGARKSVPADARLELVITVRPDVDADHVKSERLAALLPEIHRWELARPVWG